MLVLLPLFCGPTARADRQPAAGLQCVVIDPGHGGKDPGAVAGSIREKDINLGVALKLGRMLREEFPDLRVVYTRSDDRFIELDERSKIASRAGADLFISIHTNASTNAQPFGTETYVMGEDKGNRNLSVVMRENSVISLEKDYSSRYEGYDPSSSESVIMFSLMQYSYQNQSLSLAELIQREYAGHAKRADKGVKQAGFLVLWRTPMPSVLTEVGFISNPAEARYLASADGQQKIAASLARAVGSYKQRTDSRTIAVAPSSAETAATAPAAGNGSGTQFLVQVRSASRPIAINRSNFGSYAPQVIEKRIDGRYKYYCEPSDSYKEALLLQQKVRDHFPDAFLVAFRNGVQVPLSQAIR